MASCDDSADSSGLSDLNSDVFESDDDDRAVTPSQRLLKRPSTMAELERFYDRTGCNDPPFGRSMFTADLRLVLAKYKDRLDPVQYQGLSPNASGLTAMIKHILELMSKCPDAALDPDFLDHFVTLITHSHEIFKIAQGFCPALKKDHRYVTDANSHYTKILKNSKLLRDTRYWRLEEEYGPEVASRMCAVNNAF
ncbi:MAG: hypothetical protein M1828_005365 [Chrysothrix sp. TS-e1954]|nr:MAG: hypothetical protein M1828_005365 [Chrysothrix sp. TS-e1954]